MKIFKIITLIIIGITYCLLMGCYEKEHDKEETKEITLSKSDNHDKHESKEHGDDHEDEKSEHDGEEKGEHDDHKGEKEDDHDEHEEEEEGEHDDHEGENEHSDEVHLTKKAIELAGITVLSVKKRNLAKTIELPGEIGFNENNVAHITPRYAGIVKEVKKHLGAYVEKNEVLAIVESNQSLTSYKLRAPISGRIIKKHAVSGEFANEDKALFVIANLSTVWANLDVYSKNADIIKTGQKVSIEAVGSEKQITAFFSYVAPVFDKNTRSMIARAIIPNKSRNWRPGTFITGKISLTANKDVIAVNKNAVQILHEKTVVFIPVEDEERAFEPVAVKIGLTNEYFTEIVSGLHEHDKYVSNGAFEIKSKMVTSALGEHAGHGH